MPLTNEDIIASLVAYYKRTGVDMTALLGDPIFQAMKVHDKIEAIKVYAKDIHDGSSSWLQPAEKKNIAMTSVFNAWPVIPAVATVAMNNHISGLLPGIKSKALLSLGIGGAVAGLGIGAIKGYMQARDALDYRNRLRQNLENVVNNPTTTNAVGVLAQGNVMNHQFSLGRALLQRMPKEFDELHPGDFVTDRYESTAHEMNKYEQAARNLHAAQSAMSNGQN